MNLHSELRNLIDTQDVDNIQAFINEHPTLNYDAISPNGASILWWALMPPQSKNISQPLIAMLLNYVKTNGEQLCNPVQAFGGFDRPIDYVRRGVPVSLKALEALLEEAENRYVVPAPHAAPNLATIAEDAQSAHNPLITPIVYANIAKLHQHYVCEQEIILNDKQLHQTRQEIDSFINTCKVAKGKKLSIRRGLLFCFNESTHFNVTPHQDETNSEFDLTLAQLITLVWHATKEVRVELLPVDTPDVDQNTLNALIDNRRHTLLDSLDEIASAYGKDKPSCAGGAFVRLGLCLAEQHRLVLGCDKNYQMTTAQARQAMVQVLGRYLESLSTQDPESYLMVLRYRVLSQTTAKEQQAYKTFVQEITHKFNKQFADGVNEKDLTCMLATIEDGEYSDYPLSGSQTSFYLCELMTFFEKKGLETTCFYHDKAINEILAAAAAQIGQYLLNISAFRVWLEQFMKISEDKDALSFIALFIATWSQQNRQQDSAMPLDSLTHLENACDNRSLQIFAQKALFLTLFAWYKPKLIQSHSAQITWLNNLARQDIISLMSAVYANHRVTFADADFDLMGCLLLEAFIQGSTANLSLENVSFVDQDLRGFDFSHTNLEKVSFTNCLLPIAGTDIICSQVTLTNCRLPNGIEPVLDKNQWFKLFVHYCRFCESALALHWYLQNLDADFLSQRDEEGFNVLELAIMYGKTECLKTLLASPYCSEDLFKMSNKHFPNILLFAVKRGASSTACLELLLASPKCSKDLFEAQDNDGVNILMWAVRRPELAYLEVLLASSYCSKDLFEAQDIEGQNILMYMFLYSPKSIEYFKILLGSRYCSENLFKAKNNKGQNALMYAASYRKIEHFKLLLASSFNLKKALEAQDKDGRNTLILAARLGEEYLHAVLGSSYCSKDLLTKTDNEGENALMIVVMGGDIACLNMLLASPYCSKELFEAQNKSGQNALMLAIKYEKKECINILLGSPFCPMGRLKAYSKYIINDYWSSASLWSKTSIIIGVAAISLGLIMTGALVLGLSLGTTITLPTLMMTTLTFFIGAAVIANIIYMASPVVGVVASKVKDTFFNHDSQAQMNALPLSQESTEVDEEAEHNAQQPT